MLESLCPYLLKYLGMCLISRCSSCLYGPRGSLRTVVPPLHPPHDRPALQLDLCLLAPFVRFVLSRDKCRVTVVYLFFLCPHPSDLRCFCPLFSATLKYQRPHATPRSPPPPPPPPLPRYLLNSAHPKRLTSFPSRSRITLTWVHLCSCNLPPFLLQTPQRVKMQFQVALPALLAAVFFGSIASATPVPCPDVNAPPLRNLSPLLRLCMY